jgi:hypothetical protein
LARGSPECYCYSGDFFELFALSPMVSSLHDCAPQVSAHVIRRPNAEVHKEEGRA